MIQDLEKTLWATADKLRNNMDAAEYKHVVLSLIFLKVIAKPKRHSPESSSSGNIFAAGHYASAHYWPCLSSSAVICEAYQHLGAAPPSPDPTPLTAQRA